MKKIFFFTAIILSIGCSITKKTITKLLIKKVDIETSTLISIDCNMFETTFRNDSDFKSYIIENKTVLNKMNYYVENLKPSKDIREIDVRKKIIIFYSDNTKDTICANLFGIEKNGRLMIIDKSTLDFVLNL